MGLRRDAGGHRRRRRGVRRLAFRNRRRPRTVRAPLPPTSNPPRPRSPHGFPRPERNARLRRPAGLNAIHPGSLAPFVRRTGHACRAGNGTGESPVQGRLRVIVAGVADLEYGDEIEATLRAHRVAPPGNPGELDYRLHLERLGISGVAEIHDPAGIRATGERRGLPGLRQFYAFRRRMLDFLSAPENLPDKPGRIVRCLVLGEQDAPTDDQRRVFRDTGAMHFLAISGLHIALLAAICWGALAALGVGVRATSVAVFLVALTYGLLSGFEQSAQRSVILCGVWCGAYFFVRKPAVPASLALAAIFILLHNPADLFSAGSNCPLSPSWASGSSPSRWSAPFSGDRTSSTA